MFLIKCSPGSFFENLDFYFAYIILNPFIKYCTQEITEFFRRNRIYAHSSCCTSFRFDKRDKSYVLRSHLFEKVIDYNWLLNIFSIYNTKNLGDNSIFLQ